MIKCKICNKEYEDNKFYYHIRVHGLSKLEYQNRYEELPDNVVKCEICGYRSKCFITKHIRSCHKITIEEYQEKYPNSKLFSDNWKKMMSDRNKSQKMRDITASRNKENYMRETIARRNKDLEFRKKVSKGLKESSKVSQGISRGNKKKWQDPEYAKNMTKTLRDGALERWQDPEYAKRMLDIVPSKYGKKQTYYSSYFNREFSLKSNSELSFVKLCERLEISDLIYEPFGIKYEWKDESIHTYYPDFLVDNKYLIEVKYNESAKFKNNYYKSKAAINYCNSNNLKFCWYEACYHSEISNIDEIILCP